MIDVSAIIKDRIEVVYQMTPSAADGGAALLKPLIAICRHSCFPSPLGFQYNSFPEYVRAFMVIPWAP